MKKYLYVMKTTFNDSLQYASNFIFRVIGFAVTISILISLWSFIYKDGTSIINEYTFNQMVWYLILAEIITFGSGSKVATDEVRDCIKSGNIAYQVNKPYHYLIYVISKYIADTSIRFFMFFIVAVTLGFVFVGPIDGFNIVTLIFLIPVFILAVLITGIVKVLISLTSFWVEDSKPFQNVYNKIVLIFGILFPIEMFPNIIQKIIKFTPIYGMSYGPAKLAISFSFSILKDVLIAQFITIIIVFILMYIVYGRGVKKLNVNGG